MTPIKRMENKLKKLGFIKRTHKQSKSNIYVKINDNDSDLVVVVLKGKYPGDVSIKFGLRFKEVEDLLDEYDLFQMEKMGFKSPEVLFSPTVYRIVYEGAGSSFDEEDFFEKNNIKLNEETFSPSLVDSYLSAIRDLSPIDGKDTKESFYFFKRRLCILFKCCDLGEDEVERDIISNNLMSYRNDILELSRWLRNKLY